MQEYCTAKANEIPEDDGRSLLAVDQYRLEVGGIEPLDILQQRTLAQMAREGNQEARTQLIESCLKQVYCTAWRYARLPGDPDILDICQAGSEAMLQHIDEALKSRNPCAFLLVVARYAMVTCCIEDRLIRIPVSSYYDLGKRAPLIVSLMASRYGEGERMLLEELGEEVQVQEPEKSYPELEEAIGKLSQSYQHFITQYYGLGESPRLMVEDLVGEGERKKQVHNRHTRVIGRLHLLLSPEASSSLEEVQG